jgi:hypothetical protein
MLLPRALEGIADYLAFRCATVTFRVPELSSPLHSAEAPRDRRSAGALPAPRRSRPQCSGQDPVLGAGRLGVCDACAKACLRPESPVLLQCTRCTVVQATTRYRSTPVSRPLPRASPSAARCSRPDPKRTWIPHSRGRGNDSSDCHVSNLRAHRTLTLSNLPQHNQKHPPPPPPPGPPPHTSPPPPPAPPRTARTRSQVDHPRADGVRASRRL